jgi:hypothetical protein
MFRTGISSTSPYSSTCLVALSVGFVPLHYSTCFTPPGRGRREDEKARSGVWCVPVLLQLEFQLQQDWTSFGTRFPGPGSEIVKLLLLLSIIWRINGRVSCLVSQSPSPSQSQSLTEWEWYRRVSSECFHQSAALKRLRSTVIYGVGYAVGVNYVDDD